MALSQSSIIQGPPNLRLKSTLFSNYPFETFWSLLKQFLDESVLASQHLFE